MYLKELRYLESLYIRINGFISNTISKLIGVEERPTLLKLCLPEMILSTHTIKSFFRVAPNLQHVCTFKELMDFSLSYDTDFCYCKFISK